MIILDSNVVSELLHPTPDAAVIAWVARQDAESLFITTVIEAELRCEQPIRRIQQGATC